MLVWVFWRSRRTTQPDQPFAHLLLPFQLDVLAQQAAEDEAAAEQQAHQQPTSRTLLEIVALAPRAHKYSFYQVRGSIQQGICN